MTIQSKQVPIVFRRGAVIAMLGMLFFSLFGCKSRKSDLEIFDEGRIMVNLSVDVRRGYEPLLCSFTGYLETDERTVAREITEVKWIVKEPGGKVREIQEEEFNFQ